MKSAFSPVYDVVATAGSFRILRNARPLMTPKGAPYDVPREALAQVIVDEWRAQKEKIVPSSMPLTQLAATALDIVPEARASIIQNLLAFADNDLVCRRAPGPSSLVARQTAVFQPVLAWFCACYGVTMAVTESLMPIPKNPALTDVLREHLDAFDPFVLTGVRQSAETSGSLVLGLALAQAQLGARDVFEACELDVMHQNATWGEDPVTTARHKAVRFDLDSCEKWFTLLR